MKEHFSQKREKKWKKKKKFPDWRDQEQVEDTDQEKKEGEEEEEEEEEDHWILEPISGQLKAVLYRTSRDAIQASQPKFLLNFLFDSIRFRIEENQFRDLLYLHQKFSTYHTSLKYRQYRPLSSVMSNPGFVFFSLLFYLFLLVFCYWGEREREREREKEKERERERENKGNRVDKIESEEREISLF